MSKTLIAVLLAAAVVTPAFAQVNNLNDVQRDDNQQNRIEQGLQSGSLSTKEASQLEAGQQHIDRMESNADRNGSISPAEQARINAAQNRQSAAIYADKHNAVTGNPTSASSQRMQADVQRNANQQARIEQGLKSGQLTNREAGSLERGQAHVDGREAAAGANGRVGAAAQARIQTAENRQSGRIYNQKHNGVVR
jgi:hypothetical protein